MKILYLGSNAGTCRHRCDALRRLGHAVVTVDPWDALGRHRLMESWVANTGAIGCEGIVQSFVRSRIADARFDLVLVDSGELIGANLVTDLSKRAAIVVNFNQDNPYVDTRRFRLFRQALPRYDLIVTPRESSATAARAAGARRVLRVHYAADEVVHQPRKLLPEEREIYSSEVVFAGTWMRERGPLLVQLIERGVPLRIFGPRWNRAPEFQFLKRHAYVAMLGDDAYVKVIAGAKIALGLLSHKNQDLHTTRSLEIPAIGTLLCAQRSSEHLVMYRDGDEAVYWDTAEECAEVCLDLLNDTARLTRIANAGHLRAHRNRNFNQELMARIIEASVLSYRSTTARSSSTRSQRPSAVGRHG
jgi:hypothetical protein